MSKNAITIEQLNLACRHFNEMMTAGVTENMAIRTLESFADVYAKLHTGGSATPNHVDQVKLWSVEARKMRDAHPNAKPRNHFVVEHGTPKRTFARMTMDLHREGKLNDKTMRQLVKRYWKLAVITLKEDRRLNKVARSKMFDTPEKRWAATGIKMSKKKTPQSIPPRLS